MSAQFLKDKAREISYALVRVSFYIKRNELRSRLDSLAIELLEDSARASANYLPENLNKALADISALDSLVRLGHSVYEIEPVNATILIRELDALNSAIRQFGLPTGDLPKGDNAAIKEGGLPDLNDIFKIKNLEILNEKEFETNTTNNNGINSDSELITGSKTNANGLNTAIRQSAIINRIKSGNGNGCRLKELLAEFPDVSERTLRYDLNKLCEQGIIKRIGSGGPASYYTINEETLSSAVPAGV